MQNAIARDSMPQQEREQHIYNSVRNAQEDLRRKNEMFDKGGIRIYIDKSDNPELETEMLIDVSYRHLPLRDYENMLGVMNSVVRNYDKIGKRNRKKDDNHLNKHAMHLIRLFMMTIDILEKGEIKTQRTDDLALFQSIRRGDFQKEDGTFSVEFAILEDIERGYVSVLKEQGEMIGTGCFVSDHITGVYVLPKYQKKSCGRQTRDTTQLEEPEGIHLKMRIAIRKSCINKQICLK